MDNVDVVDAILEGLPKSYSIVRLYLNILHANKDTLVHSLLSKEQCCKQEMNFESIAIALIANIKLRSNSQRSFG